MASRRPPDPQDVRRAVVAVADWLADDTAPEPDRSALAEAVRLTARTLAAMAPGATLEVRVPPFVAVQCLEGPAHTRGTPPNVVETDPRTWLLLAVGLIDVQQADANGRLTLSGSRAPMICSLLPIVRLPE